jgi:hypothetical protein
MSVNSDFGKTVIAANRMCANDFSNYHIGGNICNAFAIGEIGAPDDFFLVGAPATQVDDYPVLTGNFLDSEGNPLFRLVRNVLVVNPRNCSKMRGDHIGFEIQDGEGNSVFKVESLYENGAYRTIITGTFYGKGGHEVARADKGELSWNGIQKMVMGFTGSGFGIVVNLDDQEIEVAKWCIASSGEIHQILKGEIVGQNIDLDGKLLVDVTLRDCHARIISGNFMILGNLSMIETQVNYEGPAARIHMFAVAMNSQKPLSGILVSGTKCTATRRYKSNGCNHGMEIDVAEGAIFPNCLQCGAEVMWSAVGPS